MKVIVKIIFIGMFIVGCQKFEHKDLSDSKCKLCDYAQSLEGEYRGYIYSVYSQVSDTVSVFIEQVFIGKSSIQDSLLINLKMTYSPDNSPSYVDTIRINNNSGMTMDYIYLNGTKLRNDVHSINQYSIKFEGYFYANKSHVPFRVGTLMKQ